jgi:hypothetical protein
MPRVHTLRKIARTITFLALLTAVSNVVIFARQDVASLLATTAVRVPRAFNFAVALLTGLALLGFLAVMRRAAPSIGSFVHYLWAVPRPSYAALEFKDQIAAENALRANRIQVITTAAQIVGGTVLALHSDLLIVAQSVELWFSKIEWDVIASGVFTSLPDLKHKLMRYIPPLQPNAQDHQMEVLRSYPANPSPISQATSKAGGQKSFGDWG